MQLGTKVQFINTKFKKDTCHWLILTLMLRVRAYASSENQITSFLRSLSQ